MCKENKKYVFNNVVVPLLSMEGQKAYGFQHKYLNLCFKDECLTGLEQYEGVIKDIIDFLGGEMDCPN